MKKSKNRNYKRGYNRIYNCLMQIIYASDKQTSIEPLTDKELDWWLDECKRLTDKLGRLCKIYPDIPWVLDLFSIKDACSQCNSGIYPDGDSRPYGCFGCEEIEYDLGKKTVNLNQFCNEYCSPEEWQLD